MATSRLALITTTRTSPQSANPPAAAERSIFARLVSLIRPGPRNWSENTLRRPTVPIHYSLLSRRPPF